MQQWNSPKKYSAISVIIASFCILVYLAALVSAVIRIYISIDQRRVTADQEFFDIADLASSAGVLGFMDEPFIQTMNDALAASRTLEALIITGPNGEYAFERERERAINWVNNTPRFKSRFDFSSQPLFRPLHITGLRNVNIQAIAGALDYRLLTGILKQTLLLVLAALALAFFTLIMESLLGKPAEQLRYAPSQAEDELPAESSAFTGEPVPEEPVPPAYPESIPMPEADEPLPEIFYSDNGIAVKEADPEPLKETGDRPGLYSSRGNIGWEDYTTERLNSELHRCASAEQDLAFIVMEIKQARFRGDNFYKQFADEAAHFFTLRDLIFEKGERGIAVIYPNIDLEAAFAKCDEFHSRVMGKYPDVFKAKTDLCTGLSSRAGRLIEADRLMFEAGEALDRALADPVSHIVAFKSDPEKYRAFIASQKKKRP
jgi:hypothetical protein